ncbi:MAG TPA: cupin domain-containing protein [Burkholderiales bacterium]
MNAPIRTEDAFHKLIHENSIYGLWEIASQMTPHPRPEAIPYQWKWALLERVVKESASAVPVGDERRAMQLFNPGLNGAWATTSTLIAAVQVLLPGEVARAHRHSPAAIRFILQGNGAYTAVEGEKVVMREGDLVLTPSWQWHDHGNETKETVVWMDGLDVPLTKALNSIFFEMAGERQQAAKKPVNGSKAMYGHGHLAPTWTKERPKFSPLMLYSWDQTQEALHGLRNTEGSPYEGISLEYTHAQTGGPVMPTIGCRVQLIRKGEKTKPRRVTGSSVFCVRQGKGRTLIDGKAFDWSKNDIVALPSWALHEHANTGSEDAILFSITDRPVLEALGFYREDVTGA